MSNMAKISSPKEAYSIRENSWSSGRHCWVRAICNKNNFIIIWRSYSGAHKVILVSGCPKIIP